VALAAIANLDITASLRLKFESRWPSQPKWPVFAAFDPKKQKADPPRSGMH
jgi:hypothetical protein